MIRRRISLLTILPLISLFLITRWELATSATQSLSLEWDATYGGPDADFAYDVLPTSDGGFLATGVRSNGYWQDLSVIKTDAEGQLMWEQTISLSNYTEQGISAGETPDGSYVIIGSAYIPAVYSYRPWLLKLDATGNILWSTENGLTQTINVDSAIIRGLVRSDGKIVIVGGSNTFTNVQDPWLAIVLPNGELFNLTFLEPPVTGYGEGLFFESIAPTADGGFVLAGTASPPLTGHALLWKFSAAAQPQWVRLYGDDGFRVAEGVQQTADGGYILTGCNLANCTDTMVVKTDAQGFTSWTNIYPDENNEITTGRDIITQPDGGYLLVQSRVEAIGATDMAADLLELDANGNLLTKVPVGEMAYATSLERLRAVAGENAFVLAGFQRQTAESASDFYLAKGEFASLPPLPPQTTADIFTVEAGTMLAGYDVLQNDFDPNGDTLTAVLVDDVAHGVLAMHADGKFTYEPAAGFVGADQFTYYAYDGQHMSQFTTVTITVTAVTISAPDHTIYLPLINRP